MKNLNFAIGAVGILTFSLVLASTKQAPPIDFTKFKPYSPKSNEGDYIIGAPYADAPELTVRADVPKGMVYRFTMDSKDSKIYPGIAKTAPGQVVPYTRNVTVYVPSQYKVGTKTPFFVSQDSMGSSIIPTILDNMIADHRLPTMVAIMINSGGGDAQGSQRGLEYDTMSGKYAEFIETEVLPRVSQDYHVELTKDPNGRMTMGGSSGGACALSMAWYHTDLYHRVLSYSGTFVNQQSPFNPETPRGAWEYHDGLIQNTKAKPIRIWMHVGEQDLRFNDPESTYHNWVLANNRTAVVLKEKRYHYQYVFARDSGHVDWKVLKQTLPQALEWVWHGYPIRK
jgi:iron(III)-enterobactin esterase